MAIPLLIMQSGWNAISIAKPVLSFFLTFHSTPTTTKFASHLQEYSNNQLYARIFKQYKLSDFFFGTVLLLTWVVLVLTGSRAMLTPCMDWDLELCQLWLCLFDWIWNFCQLQLCLWTGPGALPTLVAHTCVDWIWNFCQLQLGYLEWTVLLTLVCVCLDWSCKFHQLHLRLSELNLELCQVFGHVCLDYIETGLVFTAVFLNIFGTKNQVRFYNFDSFQMFT